MEKYRCWYENCSFLTIRKHKLCKHVLIHSKTPANQSKKNYKMKSRMKALCKEQQKRSYRDKYSPYRNECFICNKLCGSRYELKNHIKRHLGIKEYECSFCDRAFVGKSGLKDHIKRTHVPYQCGKCKERFAEWIELDKHMKSCSYGVNFVVS